MFNEHRSTMRRRAEAAGTQQATKGPAQRLSSSTGRAAGEGDSSRSVAGRAGGNVTLPCRYTMTDHKQLSVCWNQGDIPWSKCNNEVIATDELGVREDSRGSSRYQLLGPLDQGDVSLTILNVTELDAGRYGCRVDIPGWFNDEKHHFDLTVDSVPQTTTSATTETATLQTTDTHTAGHMNATETVPTSSSSSVIRQQESSSVTVALVCVMFGLIVLVSVGGVVVLVRKWMRLHKVRQQQLNTSIQFSSTLQLQSRDSAVENIYQIEEGVARDVYEYCP
ncbi:T-cell immunoglobulin and mucin domain-containing protein 4 isoform X3 [Pleuronectes platessa]|uniref:T-cell immunoglobulin and mucin domain-containing protein 4 isoform X3 n=1 Tax=Pleuronectes platessa TaxID=8262 RepID=UPI00232A1352|nr:T-cell immunoglobulin and mucin domain-containing protein 4 isoform X3 [Pleuronectes platessa]